MSIDGNRCSSSSFDYTFNEKRKNIVYHQCLRLRIKIMPDKAWLGKLFNTRVCSFIWRLSHRQTPLPACMGHDGHGLLDLVTNRNQRIDEYRPHHWPCITAHCRKSSQATCPLALFIWPLLDEKEWVSLAWVVVLVVVLSTTVSYRSEPTGKQSLTPAVAILVKRWTETKPTFKIRIRCSTMKRLKSAFVICKLIVINLN